MSDNGKKFDNEKPRIGEVILNFPLAIEQIGIAGTYGANKYSMDNFVKVPDAVNRYTNALFRHLIAEAKGETLDPETGLMHSIHATWNAVARLEMILREKAK